MFGGQLVQPPSPGDRCELCNITQQKNMLKAESRPRPSGWTINVQRADHVYPCPEGLAVGTRLRLSVRCKSGSGVRPWESQGPVAPSEYFVSWDALSTFFLRCRVAFMVIKTRVLG